MTAPATDFRSELAELIPKLRRFAFGICGTAHDADDLVQSAMERALRNEDQWRPGTRLDSWMYRIMQNLWIDQMRQRRSRGTVAPLEDAFAVVGEDARVTVENRDMAARAIAAFNALSPEVKAAAAMVILNGQSYRQAADALDVPIGTIMSRVARARRALETMTGKDPAR
jgi:RNA polymerase sigma-70 factor (ECF subfamily)